ncbi:sugar diacid recognition domain-containing protein [Filibacter tadaridae]|uniref:Carbohydrate diacid regulator n=1 Tax=Filibacter tadaridae TaxID=2483811 RepID=A0A3P5XNW8_9BACL|nr:sugar diacid recognition domain-containing protein [Filibacter tadaridae]VDC29511.1 Carbohydrate diacid regulator [Filibacter tadaridae]
MKFFEHIAQSIVEQTSKVLEIPLSITNCNGTIIGCTDTKRLGSHHVATSEITIANQVMLFTEQEINELENVLPGVAVPIKFQQQTIGVLGIIGNPLIVERYIQFVQSHIEMVLMQKFQSKTTTMQMETMQDFIHHLIGSEKMYDLNKLTSYSEMLGVQFNVQRYCLLIDINVMDKSTTFPQQDLFVLVNKLFRQDNLDIIAPLNQNQWIILKYVVEDRSIKPGVEHRVALDSLHQFFKTKKSTVEIIISTGSNYSGIEGISKSYREANQTLQVAKANKLEPSIHSVTDWNILSLTLSTNIQLPSKQILMTHIDKIKAHPNGSALIESFLNFCENQLNMSKSARKLYIHRNTLLYRLKQLQELIGIDVQSFEQCTLLYLALRQYGSIPKAYSLEQNQK